MKMKMKDMMVKYESTGMMSTPEKKGYYPTLNIPDKAIPELADRKVGDVCQLCIEVKIKRMSADNSGTQVDCEVLKGAYMEDDESGNEDSSSGEEKDSGY